MKIPEWLVGVVIPARNEQENIAECVTAISVAMAACPHVMSGWVVVVADSCSDRTVEHARAALADRGEVLTCAVKSPGAARRIGVEALLSRYPSADRSHLWIANTDADSRPRRDWIEQQLSLARLGVTGVAGVVRVESIGDLPAAEMASFLEYYVTNEDGSHPHVHGANLGVRGDAYVDAGGWSNLPLGEDHCLWSRVQARGWSTMSTTSSVVVTSGRLVGRAAGGFADDLRRRLELRCA